MIKSLSLKNFTAFKEIKIDLSPKINVIIGENGTGKTHLLKAMYVMSSEYQESNSTQPVDKEIVVNWMTNKLINVFRPMDDKIGKLRRSGETEKAVIIIKYPDGKEFDVSFNATSKSITIPRVNVPIFSNAEPNSRPVFIPAKEILSFMLGLQSLSTMYKLSLDETYFDLIRFLELPDRQIGTLSEKAKWAMDSISEIYGGKFVFKGGGNVTFQASNDEYSVNVMAEGFRKLGTLSRLIETGSVVPGSSGVLLWDEPDANLNPILINLLVKTLFELAHDGQQIVIATHNYNLIKWIDLLFTKDRDDHVIYHSLYKVNGNIKVSSTDDFNLIEPNAIMDAFGDISKEYASKRIRELTK